MSNVLCVARAEEKGIDMGLPNGIYRTAAGSTVTISGKYSGISAVEFDWLEEGG